MLEKLLEKLGKIPLKDVRCEFDFQYATQEQFDAFKQSFNIETKVPDWLKKSIRMEQWHEEGVEKFQGMRVALSGPESRNPNYVQVSRKKQEEEWEREQDRRRLHETTDLLWEAIVKGIITIDRDKMIAWCQAYPLDWDKYYGMALRQFSKIEKTECCK